MKQFNTIIVGCGVISNFWLDYLITRDEIKIKALVDIRKDRIRQIKEKYHLQCSEYMSLNEALVHEKANLVCDLSYVTVHKDIVTLALKSGCDVLGEKPMCLSLGEAVEMLDTVRQTKKRYILMQNRRYTDDATQIKKFLHNEPMGAPVYFCADIFVNADMASIRNELKYPQLSDNNIHIFDQARNFLNANPVSCYYHSFNPAGSKYKGDAACACIFEFDNQAVFVFRGYNGAEGLHTSWESDWRMCFERGTLMWDGNTAPCYEETKNIGSYIYKGGKLPKSSKQTDSHQTALKEILESLLCGKPSETECWDNIHSIAMVFAAMESIKKEKKVKIEFLDKAPYVILK